MKTDKGKTRVNRTWPKAVKVLSYLGVSCTDPLCRDIAKLWGSTRSCTPTQLAVRYLYELIELAKLNVAKGGPLEKSR